MGAVNKGEDAQAAEWTQLNCSPASHWVCRKTGLPGNPSLHGQCWAVVLSGVGGGDTLAPWGEHAQVLW